MLFLTHTADIANIALAIEETITTPMPGIGHGAWGNVAAAITFVLTLIGG